MDVEELQDGTFLPSSNLFSEKSQVKTVAATESGLHFVMCVIMTVEIIEVHGDAKRTSLNFIIFWSYFYVNHLICIVTSGFLYFSASNRNVTRIKTYMKLAVPIYIIWILVNLVHVVFIEPFHSLVFTLLGAVAMYKLLSFIKVYVFLRHTIQFWRAHSPLTDTDIDAFANGDEQQRSIFPGESFHPLPYNKSYEIPFENLSLESIPLGAGEYGQVLKGILKVMATEETLTVAVKTTNSNTDGCYFRSLLSELKILSYIGQHEHIVNLIGACTSQLGEKKLYIIVEFCAHGSIYNFLLARKGFFQNLIADDQIIINNSVCNGNYQQLPETVTTFDLIQWAYQTACGMDYLAGKRIIHADIASRNILLTENKSIKIADFGLSRYLFQSSTYIKKQQEPLPWRWMSFESLCSREFSIKSDVWSYAVTLWEFFTLCEVPFREFNWSQEFVNKVENGLRLPRPDFCTTEIYELMCSCWRIDPNSRPEFQHISDFFARIINTLKRPSSYCYISNV